MIRLNKYKKLKVKQKVIIKDNDWNMPGSGYLLPETVVVVTNGPTRISDVPFKVLTGSGEITHRHTTGEVTRPIEDGSFGFFFRQGHKTQAPYDFGTLDDEYFEEVN